MVIMWLSFWNEAQSLVNLFVEVRINVARTTNSISITVQLKQRNLIRFGIKSLGITNIIAKVSGQVSLQQFRNVNKRSFSSHIGKFNDYFCANVTGFAVDFLLDVARFYELLESLYDNHEIR